jgi:hypothetical protein
MSLGSRNFAGKSVKVDQKTIRYRRECEVVLSVLGPSECSFACEQHGQPIQKVTTVEEYL